MDEYIQEFCELAYLFDDDELFLRDVFCHGLNEPLRSRLSIESPRIALVDIMDFALRYDCSSLTMGLMEEEEDLPPLLAADFPQLTSAKPAPANVKSAKSAPA
ncbi:MAG: hypothetical protein ACRCZI_15515, partial [Cetobacterium sp.]